MNRWHVHCGLAKIHVGHENGEWKAAEREAYSFYLIKQTKKLLNQKNK